MPSTHVGTAPIGGFGVASSHVSTVIAVGQDPVGHAQQLVLGVMAALAPAHGGAAAAAVSVAVFSQAPNPLCVYLCVGPCFGCLVQAGRVLSSLVAQAPSVHGGSNGCSEGG
eukprot:scaffold72015_cov20-Tisochrysis_lutea.AAC.1